MWHQQFNSFLKAFLSFSFLFKFLKLTKNMNEKSITFKSPVKAMPVKKHAQY